MAVIAMTVVGWLVVPHVNEVLKKAYNFLSEDTKAKIQTLETTTLPGLKAMIEDVGINEEASRSLLQLLIELKTAAYETEDVIDKVKYKCLEHQAMGKLEKVVSKVTFIPSDLASKWKMSRTVKELKAKVTSINGFFGSLVVSNNRNNNNIRATRAPTVSTLTVEVFGRTTESKHIIDFLTASPTSNNSDNSKFKVVAILGVGGVGKTVLASYVFNHHQICSYFGPKMWLHVPHNFNEVEMTKSMIDLIPGRSFASINLEALQNELGKRLRGEVNNNRFLLVLDDVWYDEKRTLHENKERWSKLCAPLSNGGQGSMILITSRMEKAARLFPGDMKPFFLKGLKERECLALLNKHAFDAADQRTDEEDLNQIVKDIVAEISTNLGGLPLAASVAGESLRNNPREWHETKSLSNIIRGDVRNALMWSYWMLHPDLQQCIAHLSLYPKGFKFNRTSLALSWLGTGTITEDKLEGEDKLEEVRYKYFDELVSRSFFQRAGDESFVLHSLLHDVADTVSVNECMRIPTGKRVERTQQIPQTIKHLSIEVEMLGEYKEDICRLKKLRTLFLTCSNSCSDSRSVATVDHNVLKAILRKTKRLRALRLASCCIAKLPKLIGDLTHLRFLDLSNSSVNQLPKTVCKLYHLWYLDLKNCRLDDVPKDLNKLINLRHLVFDGATISMIPHIGRLTALHELKEFHVKEKPGHELGQLMNLDLLQGALRVVNLEKVAGDSEEAAKAKLKKKSGLKELALEWGSTGEGTVAVLEKLQLPREITNLTLGGYAGVTTPSWARVKPLRLKTLVLNNCPNRHALPPLGQLFAAVQKLELRDSSELRYLPPLPPNLKKLVLSGCSQVAILTKEELQTTDVAQKRIDFESRQVVIEEGEIKRSLMGNERVMHVLQELTMSLERGDATSPPLTCLDRWVVELKLEAISEKLARTPHGNHIQQLPSSLQHLQLHDCFVDDSTLSECLESLTSLTFLELSKCACITSLPSNRVSRLLTRLNVLQVTDCVLLTSLGGILALSSLEVFKVRSCPNFLAVVPSDRGNAFLPESLADLRITDCGLLDDRNLSSCLMGLTRLTFLELHNCAHVTSLSPAVELERLKSLEHLRREK